MSEYLFGVGVVDTMIGFPSDPEQVYGVMRRALRDRESREEFVMPASYMFTDERAHGELGVRAASLFPHGVIPEVALDAPMADVVYAKCVELGIPVFVTVGIAGPRLPSMVPNVERIDEVWPKFLHHNAAKVLGLDGAS